ncbi:hypothetical protein FQA39_LY02939 [Lamprigera yunnana]|nr:hypothetical protein FQA39_LY02939 [Lamprigera yunnana]
MNILAVFSLLAVAAALPNRLIVPVKDAQGKNRYVAASSRIISGQPAKVGEFPFQVHNIFSTSQGTSFCGGALISSRWVLTAGHCVYGAFSFQITLGTIYSSGNDPKAVVRYTTRSIIHTGYDSFLLWNDVALIDLKEVVTFTSLIQPVKLGSRTVGDSQLVVVSGWGKTSDATPSVSPTLNWVSLKTILNSACSAVYGLTVTANTLCCVGAPHHSTCNGDSGGPLFEYDSTRNPFHVGVVSFVHKAGCASGNPSGFSRTSSYIPWIQSHTGVL